MPNIGPLELILVLIIALVVLGPQKLPEVGRSVGRGMREFRSALSSAAHDDAEDEEDLPDEEDDDEDLRDEEEDLPGEEDEEEPLPEGR